MIVMRLFVALPALALLAACGKSAPTNDSRSASGEVLQGTISDAMLPVDQVRSEPPLEDPKAFAKAQSEGADEGSDAAAKGEQGEAGENPTGDTADTPPAEPTPQAAN